MSVPPDPRSISPRTLVLINGRSAIAGGRVFTGRSGVPILPLEDAEYGLMAGYKEPSFQDRVTAAAEARAKALARLQARPALDPAVQAEREAKALEREAVQAEKRKAAQANREARRAEQRVKAQALAEAATTSGAKPELTEAERKAARDARYAARKSRKK